MRWEYNTHSMMWILSAPPAERIILILLAGGGAESIILSVGGAESMMLSVCAESMILSAALSAAESIETTGIVTFYIIFDTYFESRFIHTLWNDNVPFAILICVCNSHMYLCNFHVSPYGSYVDVCNSHMYLQFSYTFAILLIGSPSNADGNRQRREWKQSKLYFNDNSSALIILSGLVSVTIIPSKSHSGGFHH